MGIARLQDMNSLVYVHLRNKINFLGICVEGMRGDMLWSSMKTMIWTCQDMGA